MYMVSSWLVVRVLLSFTTHFFELSLDDTEVSPQEDVQVVEKIYHLTRYSSLCLYVSKSLHEK